MQIFKQSTHNRMGGSNTHACVIVFRHLAQIPILFSIAYTEVQVWPVEIVSRSEAPHLCRRGQCNSTALSTTPYFRPLTVGQEYFCLGGSKMLPKIPPNIQGGPEKGFFDCHFFSQNLLLQSGNQKTPSLAFLLYNLYSLQISHRTNPTHQSKVL